MNTFNPGDVVCIKSTPTIKYTVHKQEGDNVLVYGPGGIQQTFPAVILMIAGNTGGIRRSNI